MLRAAGLSRGKLAEATTLGEATPTPTKEQLAEWEKEAQENYRKVQQERIEQEKQHRELLLKQEAERESRGDFSQAPGLTAKQKEEAEIKWAEKNAAESIKGHRRIADDNQFFTIPKSGS